MPAIRLSLRRFTIRALSKTHLLVYRLSGGRLLARVAGMPVLLLKTTGRRSGEQRVTPLTFFEDGDDLAVVASNGGSDRAPDWFLNLQQDPRAVVEIAEAELPVTARTASPEERERLWKVITASFAPYARYQTRTTRQIPVVILTVVRFPGDGDGGSRATERAKRAHHPRSADPRRRGR
ncbi:MAG TPA: nitroreductase family deazaflavin-dependent oxidoreductase [Gaiellaceae bacterium]|nr:nitroreductase family deazaflavin-dependent oxidoreductase [Gaiellaceae bacterium]